MHKKRHKVMRKKKVKKKNHRKRGYITFIPVIMATVIILSFLTTETIEAAAAMFLSLATGFLVICIVVDTYKHIRYLRSDIRDIDRMSGEEFEHYLRLLFEKNGYKVTLTPKSQDYGVDLICEKKEKHSVQTRRIAVQAKRYRDKVGVSAIQQVAGGMMYYDCNEAMVITNSLYTDNAKKLARKSNVILWDRNSLKREIRKVRERIL